MSTKIRCLIIDDEPIARQIIETYCGHLQMLEVVATTPSSPPLEAWVVDTLDIVARELLN